MKKAKHLTYLALLCALSVIISIVESMIPPLVPVPGVKLGLSNIVILWVMYSLGAKNAFYVLIARILITGIFAGQLTGLIYSFSGGLLCFGVMLVLKKLLSIKYIVTVSIFGALAHNIGQLMAASLVLGNTVWYYLPYLVVSAVLSGAFTGLCAMFLSRYNLQIK